MNDSFPFALINPALEFAEVNRLFWLKSESVYCLPLLGVSYFLLLSFLFINKHIVINNAKTTNTTHIVIIIKFLFPSYHFAYSSVSNAGYLFVSTGLFLVLESVFDVLVGVLAG